MHTAVDQLASEAQTHLEWRYLQTRHRLTGNTHTNTVAGVSATFYTETFREYLRARDYQNESFLIHRLLDEVEPADVFWDIGANIGTHSCYVGQRVSDVISIEPHPWTALRLVENCRMNDVDATVLEMALSNESGTTELCIPDRFDDELGVGTFTTKDHDDTNTVCSAPVTTGDSALTEHDLPRPTVLKIDVEGAEYDVLRGFETALESCRAIFCEVHERYVDSDPIVDLLTNNGYSVKLLRTRSRETQLVARK